MTSIWSRIWDFAGKTSKFNSYVYAAVILVLSVICLWKIFEARGQGGWKALIPFYSDYVFGVISKERKLGKKVMLAEIFSILAAVALVAMCLILLTFSRREYDPVSGDFVHKQSPPSYLTILTIVTAIVLVWLLISMVVWKIKLYHRFVLLNHAPGWMTLIFVFIPVLALGYFAFLRGTNNDPFPPAPHY